MGQVVPTMSRAEERKTHALVARSVVLHPKRRDTCATKKEPSSPPRPKPLTTSDHCQSASSCLVLAAMEAGASCSRLLSAPVPKPNWKEVPMDTEPTTTISLAMRT